MQLLARLRRRGRGGGGGWEDEEDVAEAESVAGNSAGLGTTPRATLAGLRSCRLVLLSSSGSLVVEVKAGSLVVVVVGVW